MSYLCRVDEKASKPITLAPLKPVKKKRRRPQFSPEQAAMMAAHMAGMRNDEVFEKRRIEGVRRRAAAMTPEQKRAAYQQLKKHEAKRLVMCRAANAARFEDPKNVEALAEMARNLWRTGRLSKDSFKNRKMSPEGLARKSAASKRMQDRRRGFTIPPAMRPEYDFLVNKKKMPARKAGILLGLVRPIKIQGKAASFPQVLIHMKHIREAILTLAESSSPLITMEVIASMVVRLSGVSLTDMKSERRDSRVLRARGVFCYLCRTITRHSLPKIGQYMGGRDHTTVINSIRRLEAHTNEFQPLLSQCVNELRKANG